MITKDELLKVGSIAKSHGLNGEVNAVMDIDVDINIDALERVAIEIDGIFVPFYVDSARLKGQTTVLLKFDGIDSAEKANELSGQPLYLFLKDDLVDDEELPDDGFYASDLIGFTIVDDEATVVGEVVDIDDSTENTLFVVTTRQGKEILIPVADEFIEEINESNKEIVMSLPSGLFDLN